MDSILKMFGSDVELFILIFSVVISNLTFREIFSEWESVCRGESGEVWCNLKVCGDSC